MEQEIKDILDIIKTGQFSYQNPKAQAKGVLYFGDAEIHSKEVHDIAYNRALLILALLRNDVSDRQVYAIKEILF